MKSRDEGDAVSVLKLVAGRLEQLPVGVVDEDDYPWADRPPLNEHLLLFLQVLSS